MKVRLAINKQEPESKTLVDTENQQTSESNEQEYTTASLNRATMPPAGNPGVKNHAGLARKSLLTRSGHSQQLFHHLQRTHGNRYAQRIVELSRKGHESAEVDQDIEQTIQSKRNAKRGRKRGRILFTLGVFMLIIRALSYNSHLCHL
ncbi:hypothetical protein [Nitrosomonas sp.]|uniref:hypothetical protein n=1 Tax=Nitrosomonas sp. TaxID=42353 RepID=UPI0020811066|nr:hypothetical protein [Nitrosomonas sp.]GJL76408.1 MAG: hypothetical protein NMNS02_25140 [Nitrosomonas sp.]